MELPIEFALSVVKKIVRKRARYSYHILRHSEDIQQEAMIYLFTNWRKFPPTDVKDTKAFATQLAKWGVANAVRNKCMNVVKAKRGTFALTVSTYSKDEWGQGDEDRFLRQESTHEIVEDKDDLSRVVEGAGLTAKETELLSCHEDTLEDVATKLGVTAQAIHQRVTKAMKKLAESSLRQGVRDTPLTETCKPKFKVSVATLSRLQDLIRGGTKRAAAARELGVDQTTACRYIDAKGNFREYYYEQHKERRLD